MSEFTQRAQIFRDRTDKHFNCAQSVLLAFAPTLGLTEETAWKLSRNFGGGMKTGDVCGAYTGGLMVLGLAGIGDDDTVKEFREAFCALEEGRLDCRDLLSVNSRRGGEKKPFCDRLVRESAALLEEMLRRRGAIG